MSSNTNNLGLIKPALSDEIHQTIADLAVNFQKLDDESDKYFGNPPTSGDWGFSNKVWNSNPASNAYVGWVCLRAGKAAPKWSGLNPYISGNFMIPLADNGHIYQCIQGGTSGVIEPNLPTTASSTVEDHNGSTIWQAATTYAVNAIVTPSADNGCFYVCEIGGISGSVEPNWSATSGDFNLDGGTVKWRTYRIAIWKEVGVSALFKGFGKIE